jgi:asparagine synthase (glutamine-hydrolysing)
VSRLPAAPLRINGTRRGCPGDDGGGRGDVCGLVGCLATSSEAPVASAWLPEAAAAIACRGPDESSALIDGELHVGFRRLAVVDPSDTGGQPMYSRDGRYLLVYNGELYNAPDLAASLQAAGLPLRGSSDTEVLLELLALRGVAVLADLRGMFAFALWDRQDRVLLAARDPFGIKPFFYRTGGGSFRFASEKKALLDQGRQEAVDRDALRRFLALQYVPGPTTTASDVLALPPGHLLTVRPGGRPTVEPYPTDLPPVAGRPRRPRPPAAQILDVLRDSVTAHLRSDRPLGAFLSGGIDSALICALAAEQLPDLQTFTVGFDAPGFSEIENAADIAAALGVRHTPCVVGVDEFRTELPRILWHLDDPFGDASAVPLWFLARRARAEVTVVLSGEGSDELFGGYHVYRHHTRMAVRLLGALPPGRGMARLAGRAAGRFLGPTSQVTETLVLAARTPDRRYRGADEVFDPDEVDRLVPRRGLAGGRAAADDVTSATYADARARGLDPVRALQVVDQRHWLPGDILHKADRMSMAHGLELRVPFLDRRVASVAARLASEDRIAGGTTKAALRRAAAAVLPATVARRPKLGFPVPIRLWLRGELFDFAEQVLAEGEYYRLIRRDTALRLLHGYRAGRHDAWRKVWVVLCFALWHQIYVEGRYDPVELGWQVPFSSPSGRMLRLED